MNKKLITLNEKTKDEIISELTTGLETVEKSVFDEIMAFIDRFGSDGGNFTGILTAEQINELEARIDSILTNRGYAQKVDLFIRDMGKLTVNSELLLNSLDYGVSRFQLTDIEKKWQRATWETLRNSGIRKDFKRPIVQVIDDSITYGRSIGATRNTLEEYVIGGKDKSGKLKSYLTQTARDSVSQMQGQQYNNVANAIGYVGISYVGGLLEDSRGQCTRWINTLNGFIPKEQLAEEIKLAYKNQRLKKVDGGVHRWGGMMPDTKPDNFIIKRGGFNCTHTALPKRKK